MLRRHLIAVWALVPVGLCAFAPNVAPAQTDAAGTRPSAAWKLERVILPGGKAYEGLVAAEGPAEIEFVEVHRPTGKPMHLVVRSIDRKSIETWSRLNSVDRAELGERIEGFRNRARIEARRMEDLRLTPIRRDGTVYWQYQGEWFSLESTADETMTRRSIVRIEQVFTAYRQILPPRATAHKRLQILLFGDTDRYREFLGGLGLDLENPAFFAADFNLVVAGSDLNRFVAQLAKVRREHQNQRQEYEKLLADAPDRLRELNEQLRRAGVPADERQRVAAAEQRRWKDIVAHLDQRTKAADRRNAERYQEVAGQMFHRLNHEAFHAYLENFVYPHALYDVPRWLNEGLAQTFEGGLLEADMLRLDAPSPRRLSELQRDLLAPRPLTLEELLSADANMFLSAHRGNAASASRLYLYSWGLAYYLAFEQPLLGSKKLERYVSSESAAKSDVERFEELVGTPLAEFERQWRATMLGLAQNGRNKAEPGLRDADPEPNSPPREQD
jgi:hypothetical protein